MSRATIIRWFFAAGLLAISLPSASVRAQTPGAAPVVMLAPPAPAVEMIPPQAQPIPVPAAAPPPYPKPANWGNYVEPLPPPIGPQVYDYTLAAPPEGIIQSDVPGQYRAPVANAETLLGRDVSFHQAINLYRPDGLAPVGVLQDATLPSGQFLFSYRFDYQSFQGDYVGTHRVSNASVAANYPFVPTKMNVGRHLLLVQYGITDDFTFFGELPFQSSALDYDQTGVGQYRTAFTNPADITLSGMYVLWRGNRQQLHMNFGMNFPVGFLDSQRDIPSPTLPNLPYAIRAGSGTYDLLPGLTYRGQTDRWSWGVQSIGTIRTGSNRLDYRLGDRADVTAWVARCWSERISTSFRLDGQTWGNIRGGDPRLNPAVSPTNDPNLQGGTRLDLLFGVNLFLPSWGVSGQRLSIEAGAPAYQSLSGPQLGTNWLLNTGWNMIW